MLLCAPLAALAAASLGTTDAATSAATSEVFLFLFLAGSGGDSAVACCLALSSTSTAAEVSPLALSVGRVPSSLFRLLGLSSLEKRRQLAIDGALAHDHEDSLRRRECSPCLGSRATKALGAET